MTNQSTENDYTGGWAMVPRCPDCDAPLTCLVAERGWRCEPCDRDLFSAMVSLGEPVAVSLDARLAPLAQALADYEEGLRDAEIHHVWPAYEDNPAECTDECPGCAVAEILDAALAVTTPPGTEAGGQ